VWLTELRTRNLLFGPGLALMLVAGCMQVPQPTAQPKILTVAWGIEPKILTVSWVWDNPAASIDQLIFDPLVRVDIMGGIHPGLADSWDISPDGKTYTFHLAKNVKFHDGAKLTSADVKWTLETIVSEKGPGAGDLASIDQITTPDDNTVVIQLKVTDPRILENLYGTNQTGSIMQKRLSKART
jgi:peptide/nickel transport system substrate-binding protein